MYLKKYYIVFKDKELLETIINDKNDERIFRNFVDKMICKGYNIEDSILYGRYYVNYKKMNCGYNDEIMRIIKEYDNE